MPSLVLEAACAAEIARSARVLALVWFPEPAACAAFLLTTRLVEPLWSGWPWLTSGRAQKNDLLSVWLWSRDVLGAPGTKQRLSELMKVLCCFSLSRQSCPEMAEKWEIVKRCLRDRSLCGWHLFSLGTSQECLVFSYLDLYGAYRRQIFAPRVSVLVSPGNTRSSPE